MEMQWIWTRPRMAAAAVVLALGLGGIAVGGAHLMNEPAKLKFASADEPPSHNSYAPVVKKVLPSVVTITSSRMVKTGFQGGEDGIPPMFRQFFGDEFDNQGGQFRAPRQQREQGLGSGVIVSPNGYILTNNHVVDHAASVTVIMPDKHEYKARVVGADPKTDIAVLKVEAGSLEPITIGDSDKVQVGDFVLAVGNPFGVGKTVTMGIVSATGRANLGIEDYEDFIQTDASINPGNSGGALVNERGELIGINTAILSNGSRGGNQGIGFAVPVGVARSVMDQIIRDGKVTRAYLGVMAQEVTPAIAKAFHQPEVRGALIGDVTPNSPAERAGLEKGDILLDINGKPVNSSAELRMRVSLMAPGTKVNVKVFRGGAEKVLPLTLAEMPTVTAKNEQPENGSEDSLQGITVENATARTARQLGLPANAAGVVVTGVDPASKAAESGLKRGDVIQEVNHKPVRNTSDFEAAVRGAKEDSTLLLVNRQGNTMFLAV